MNEMIPNSIYDQELPDCPDCPKCGGTNVTTWFVIAPDSGVEWSCDDCNHAWDDSEDGPPLEYVAKGNR